MARHNWPEGFINWSQRPERIIIFKNLLRIWYNITDSNKCQKNYRLHRLNNYYMLCCGHEIHVCDQGRRLLIDLDRGGHRWVYLPKTRSAWRNSPGTQLHSNLTTTPGRETDNERCLILPFTRNNTWDSFDIITKSVYRIFLFFFFCFFLFSITFERQWTEKLNLFMNLFNSFFFQQ